MTAVYKRFSAEITELIFLFDSVLSNKKNDGINITLTIENNNYTLFLTKGYPFRIPEHIQYNGVCLKRYLYLNNTPLIYFYLKRYYNMDYYNIIEHDNWTPAIKISKLISIFEENVKIKNEIMYRFLCFKIKNKYNCSDADFESYLFYYDRKMYFK
jgi:hypothetical protein